MIKLNPREFIEKEYPLPVRAQFIPMLKTGMQVAQSIFDEHPEIYFSTMGPNIRGRLFAFAVMLQFTPELGLFHKAQYQTRVKKVNSFGYTIPEIVTQNSVMHISKSQSKNRLPASAKYKKEYANCNDNFDCGQMVYDFDFSNKDIEGPFVSPKYIMLNYGSRDNRNIDFAQLILPNSGYSNILDGHIDLFEEIQLIKNNETTAVGNREKELVALKANVLKNLNIDIADIEL